MESSTPSGRKRLISWQGILFTAFLLTFWSLPTTAQLAIVSTNAVEGQDVLLQIRNKPPDAAGFMWYRGEKANSSRYIAFYSVDHNDIGRGPEFTGREMINKEGSMLIKKVTLKDTGHYTMVAYLQNSKKEIGFGQLHVYPPVGVPTLLASSTTVKEHNDSVVLTCYTRAMSTKWFLNGISLQFTERMKLSWNNRTLTIDPVRREDAGNYQCEVSNPVSSNESEPVELDVIH